MVFLLSNGAAGRVVRAFWLACVVALPISASSRSLSSLPSLSEQPTARECRDVENQYNQAASRAYHEALSCTDNYQEPYLGDGREVGSAEDGCPVSATGVRAYPDCFSYELNACRIEERGEKVRAKCDSVERLMSARHASSTNSSGKNESNSHDQFREYLKHATEHIKQIHEGIEFVSNPDGFIKKSMMRVGGDKALKVFYPDGSLRPGYMKSANSILSIAKGDDLPFSTLSNDPIIGNIQSIELQYIVDFYGKIMSGLDRKMAELDQLDEHGVRLSHEMRVPTLSRHNKKHVAGEADCSVFKSESSSAALMNRNPGLWASLLSKCKN